MTDSPSADRILADLSAAVLHPWGLQDYGAVLSLQELLHAARRTGTLAMDAWLVGEHPTVITQGVRGCEDDLVRPDSYPVYQINRGGMTTLHNPGQLVIYPIARTAGGLLAQARMSLALLAAMRDLVRARTGIELAIPKGRPGLFHGERKVAAIGLAIRGHVTMHGIAVNLCNDLRPWKTIVPCGEPSTRPITLSEILGRRLEPSEWLPLLPEWLRHAWGYKVCRTQPEARLLLA
ncbi:MAG: lipoyl(octanoyl) transferase LipB [bacterium]|nr:lipoyl(octanoyl) transferase LipB [bacterium]